MSIEKEESVLRLTSPALVFSPCSSAWAEEAGTTEHSEEQEHERNEPNTDEHRIVKDIGEKFVSIYMSPSSSVNRGSALCFLEKSKWKEQSDE